MDRAKIKDFFSGALLDAVFRLLAVGALIVGATATLETKHLAECQIKYNDYFNERARILTDAAEQERSAERRFDEAQADLFLDPAVLRPEGQRTPEEIQRLIAKRSVWFDATRAQGAERAEADRARAEHPIPESPSKQCS